MYRVPELFRCRQYQLISVSGSGHAIFTNKGLRQISQHSKIAGPFKQRITQACDRFPVRRLGGNNGLAKLLFGLTPRQGFHLQEHWVVFKIIAARLIVRQRVKFSR